MGRDTVLLIADECRELALKLSTMFQVLFVNSLSDAHPLLSKHEIKAAIVDLDCVPVSEVEKLNRDWGLSVVCVHRLANERLWVNSLRAGAIDCCYPDDHPQIVAALRKARKRPQASTMAA